MLKGKREAYTLLKLVLLMKENGQEDLEMGMECNNGQMEQGMKANGEIIGLMEKENSHIQMETFMKGTG